MRQIASTTGHGNDVGVVTSKLIASSHSLSCQEMEADLNATPNSQRVSTEVAALRVGLSVSSLNKYRVHGGGPPYFKIGRRVVYDLAAVDSWLAERAFTTTSEYK